MEEEDEEEKEVTLLHSALIGSVIGIIALLIGIFVLGLEFGVYAFSPSGDKICTSYPPQPLGRKELVLSRKWNVVKHGFLHRDTFTYYCSDSPSARLYAVYQCNAEDLAWEIIYESTCDCTEGLPAITGTLIRVPSKISNHSIGSIVIYKCSAEKDSIIRAVYRCNNDSHWELITDVTSACQCNDDDPPDPEPKKLRVWNGNEGRYFGVLVKYYCYYDEESAIEKVVRCETNGKWKTVFQKFCGCKGLPHGIVDSKYKEFFYNLTIPVNETVTIYCDPENPKSGVKYIIECNKTTTWSLVQEDDCTTTFRVIPDQLNYEDAKKTCSDRGGKLSYPENEKEREKLSDILEPHLAKCPTFYLGIEEDLSSVWYSDGAPYKFNVEIESNFTSELNKCIVIFNPSVNGFVHNEDCSALHCYICYFPNNAQNTFQVFKSLVNFKEALIACDIEGYLAPLTALNHLLNHFRIDSATNEFCDGYYYVDGINNERKWLSIDNEPLTYTDWAVGVPGNFSDHCVVASNESDLQWVTTNCHSKHCSICKIAKKLYWPDKESSEQPDLYKCPEPLNLNLTTLDEELYSWPNKSQMAEANIIIYCFKDKMEIREEYKCSDKSKWELVQSNKCEKSYQPFHQLQTVDNAARICRLLNGSLADANESSSMTAIKDVVDSQQSMHLHCRNGYTLGMFENIAEQWEVECCPGMLPGYVNITRSMWANEKYPGSVSKKCLVINTLYDNKLTNENCEERSCFICETINLDYEVRGKFLTYEDASNYCKKRNNMLATFRNEKYLSKLQAAVIDFDDSFCTKYFIGVRNYNRSYYWAMQTKNESVDKSVKVERMDSFRKNCVTLGLDNAKADMDCSSYPNCFVCSLPPSYFAKRSVTFDESRKCLKGFEYVGGKCYKFIKNLNLDSQLAHEQCLRSGGTLATISNSKELADLFHILPKKTGTTKAEIWHFGLVKSENGKINWRNGQIYNDFPEVTENVDEKEECGAILVDYGNVELQFSESICSEAGNFICKDNRYFFGFIEEIDKLFVGDMDYPQTDITLYDCKQACVAYSFYYFNKVGDCVCRNGPSNNVIFRASREELMNDYNYFDCIDVMHCKDNKKQICGCDDKSVLYFSGWPIYLGCFKMAEELRLEKSSKPRDESTEELSTHWCPISCWQNLYAFAVLDLQTNGCKCFKSAPGVIHAQENDCRGKSTYVRFYRM